MRSDGSKECKQAIKQSIITQLNHESNELINAFNSDFLQDYLQHLCGLFEKLHLGCEVTTLARLDSHRGTTTELALEHLPKEPCPDALRQDDIVATDLPLVEPCDHAVTQ